MTINMTYIMKFNCGTQCLKIINLYDAPHLLKEIRNNVLKKIVVFTINREHNQTSWDHVFDLYKLYSNIPVVRMLPKLTRGHIDRNKIKKIKLRNATHVLSEQLSSIFFFIK